MKLHLHDRHGTIIVRVRMDGVADQAGELVDEVRPGGSYLGYSYDELRSLGPGEHELADRIASAAAAEDLGAVPELLPWEPAEPLPEPAPVIEGIELIGPHQMVESIDLNEEEEAALDAVWKKIQERGYI